MGSTPVKFKPVTVKLIFGLAWLVTALIGLAAIYTLYQLAIIIYALIGDEYYVGVLIGQITIVLAGLLWLVVIIVTGEFYIKHAGERKSWIILGWVLGIELLILLLGLFIG